MARWDPGAEERLRQAALELCLERGYVNVTVTDIAERAGLTRRSFFRYFPDKREVFFAGSEQLPPALGAAIAAAPKDASPLAAVLGALAQVGAQLIEQLDRVPERRAIIDSSPELQERARTKEVAITGAIREALQQRGAPDETAELVAQLACVVSQSAFRRWAQDGGRTPIERCVHEVADELRAAFDGA